MKEKLDRKREKKKKIGSGRVLHLITDYLHSRKKTKHWIGNKVRRRRKTFEGKIFVLLFYICSYSKLKLFF
jgi:hypothetical protein